MNIDDEICIARAKHELEVELCEKRLNLINLRAETSKANQLAKIQSSRELVLAKHEHELMLIDYRLKLGREEVKQLQAKYQLEIQLPSRIEALNIEESSNIKSQVDRIRFNANLDVMIRLARAQLAFDKAEALAESRGLKSIASACEQYLTALVIDRLSGQLLCMLARCLQVDPSFRVKLYRPLSRQSTTCQIYRLSAGATCCSCRSCAPISQASRFGAAAAHMFSKRRICKQCSRQ